MAKDTQRGGRNRRFSTVLIADAHPLIRAGLRHLLDGESDLTICGEASSVDDVRVLTRERRPDLVILDLDLPGDGFAILEELRSTGEGPRVLVLGGDDHSADAAARALWHGASAFVSKLAYGDELLRKLRDALQGRILFDGPDRPSADRQAASRDGQPLTISR